MADSKISALPASTTPLAGTEVLPIVQSSTTRQVSVANLTAGRAISATQLTLTTGNLIVASGFGIDFSATSGTGTSELFADYEEGTFTAARTGFTEVLAGGTITSTGTYTKVGRLVTVNITLECTGAATIAGASGAVSYFDLPFTSGYDAAGVWANRTLVNANGGVLVNSVQMYLTTGFTASGNTRIFSATYSV
jgi:hypothetical protein